MDKKRTIFILASEIRPCHRQELRSRRLFIRNIMDRKFHVLDELDRTEDPVFLLAANFPFYDQALGLIMSMDCRNILVEMKEEAKMERPRIAERMAFLPYGFDRQLLAFALDCLGIIDFQPESMGIYWGQNEEMEKIRKTIPLLLQEKITVHLEGEIGTGKNTIAEMIASKAHGRPSVYLNCASLSSALAEDDLFGHEKGAFTSADSEREGLCSKADGGTLFLDELQDLSFEVQAKLLHLLETGCFRRRGSDKTVRSTFKLITSSSLPWEELEKKMRKDFLARIGLVIIRIPPLRKRIGELDGMVSFIGRKMHLKRIPEGRQMEAMKRYAWPGNFRELQRCLEYYDLIEELPPPLKSMQT